MKSKSQTKVFGANTAHDKSPGKLATGIPVVGMAILYKYRLQIEEKFLQGFSCLGGICQKNF